MNEDKNEQEDQQQDIKDDESQQETEQKKEYRSTCNIKLSLFEGALKIKEMDAVEISQ